MSEDKLYGTAAESGLPVNQIRRIQRRLTLVDAHHEFGEAMSKYGPVFHKVRSFDQDSWEMVTEVTIRLKDEHYDPYTIKHLAERIDWITRGPGSTVVELTAKLTSTVDDSSEPTPAMSEQEGVEDAD